MVCYFSIRSHITYSKSVTVVGMSWLVGKVVFFDGSEDMREMERRWI